MRTTLISLICAFTLAGCATTPIPAAHAKPAPKERVVAFQEKNAASNAMAVVTRDSGILGSGCLYGFWIDGTLPVRDHTLITLDVIKVVQGRVSSSY